MAGAFQTGGFAFQGVGQFAFQTEDTAEPIGGGTSRRRRIIKQQRRNDDNEAIMAIIKTFLRVKP